MSEIPVYWLIGYWDSGELRMRTFMGDDLRLAIKIAIDVLENQFSLLPVIIESSQERIIVIQKGETVETATARIDAAVWKRNDEWREASALERKLR